MKETFLIIFLSLALFLALLKMVFLMIHKMKLAYILKSFPLLLLGLSCIFFEGDYFYLLIITLLLYSLGDLLLLSPSKTMFLFGSFSFLFGHFTYLIYFILVYFPYFRVLPFIVSLLISLFFQLVTIYHFKSYLKSFTFGAFCYLFALLFLGTYIGLMVLESQNNYHLLITSLGFIIFYISDIFVIRKHFVEIKEGQDVLIMSLYYLANFICLLPLLFPF